MAAAAAAHGRRQVVAVVIVVVIVVDIIHKSPGAVSVARHDSIRARAPRRQQRLPVVLPPGAVCAPAPVDRRPASSGPPSAAAERVPASVHARKQAQGRAVGGFAPAGPSDRAAGQGSGRVPEVERAVRGLASLLVDGARGSAPANHLRDRADETEDRTGHDRSDEAAERAHDHLPGLEAVRVVDEGLVALKVAPLGGDADGRRLAGKAIDVGCERLLRCSQCRGSRRASLGCRLAPVRVEFIIEARQVFSENRPCRQVAARGASKEGRAVGGAGDERGVLWDGRAGLAAGGVGVGEPPQEALGAPGGAPVTERVDRAAGASVGLVGAEEPWPAKLARGPVLVRKRARVAVRAL
mmetsp:Transcript_3987/g.16628  ORF Transcript_3987/g.16628 Transcript_3987/m.16628 type:complete len:354 (-) Transcript_3987:1159-2220(-)